MMREILTDGQCNLLNDPVILMNFLKMNNRFFNFTFLTLCLPFLP